MDSVLLPIYAMLGLVVFFSVSSGARSTRFGYQRGFVIDAFRPLLDVLHRGRVFACDEIRGRVGWSFLDKNWGVKLCVLILAASPFSV